jgi:hypothetical protein
LLVVAMGLTFPLGFEDAVTRGLGRAAACRLSPQAAPRAGQHTQLPWGGPGHGGHPANRPLAAPLVRVWPPAAPHNSPQAKGPSLASLGACVHKTGIAFLMKQMTR